jgi:hypothetical protein
MPSPPECSLDPFYDPDYPPDTKPAPDLRLDMPAVELKEFIAQQLRRAQLPEPIRQPRPKPRVRTRGYLTQEN